VNVGHKQLARPTWLT